MTSAIIATASPAPAEPSTLPHRRSVRSLCLIEAKRYCRRLSMWIGVALTILFSAINFRAEGAGGFSGDRYESAIPVGLVTMYLGVFIAGARTGGRDQSTDHPGLAEEAPLDRNDRALARLAGLAVPLALSAVVVAGIAIASRIEGGFWIGDFPRRTDTALHSFVELLQPVLVVALFGAAGVAAGSAAKRSAPVIVVGAVVWVVACMVYWGWQSNGVHLFALVQTQPMSLDLPAGTDPTALPADWYTSAPNEYESLWQRQLIHLPTVLWHNVYLLGLTALCCGLAIRRTLGTRITVIGLAVAAIGVAGQAVVSPF